MLIAVVAFVLGALLWWLRGPGAMDFAGGKAGGTGRLSRGRTHRHAGGVAGCGPGGARRVSGARRGLHGLPHRAGRRGVRRRLAFKLPFGALYSTNITPDKETGIGNYSDAQFLAALHRGVRSDGARLYPAMPFTSYTYMTDADALAIKAYLFSLAPVHAPARSDALSFPFNQRWLLGIWSWLFNADQRFQPNPTRSPEWNRGAYVSEALAHCGECHTPRNLAFALNNRRKFGGAVTAGWRAYNITSDAKTGVGEWNDDLTATISHGAMPRVAARPPARWARRWMRA